MKKHIYIFILLFLSFVAGYIVSLEVNTFKREQKDFLFTLIDELEIERQYAKEVINYYYLHDLPSEPLEQFYQQDQKVDSLYYSEL